MHRTTNDIPITRWWDLRLFSELTRISGSPLHVLGPEVP